MFLSDQKGEAHLGYMDLHGRNTVGQEVSYHVFSSDLSDAAQFIFTLRLSGGGGSFPRPLKPEEEKRYLERCAAGDLEARNVLVEHNLRLVAHIVKKYYAQTGDQG